MPKRPVVATVRALVVFALVVTGFFTLIKTTNLDRSQMGQLALQQTGIPGIKAKPTSASATDVTESPLAAILDSAKTHPDKTGVWGAIWPGPVAADRTVVLTVNYLPNLATTAKAAKENEAQLLSTSALKTYSVVQHFTVASLPHMVGAYLFSPQTSSASASSTIVIGFYTTHVFVLVTNGGSTTVSKPQSIAFAEREYALVRKVEPHFTMLVTTHPVGYSILYWFLGIALTVFVFGGRDWIIAARERRAAHKAALERYHFQARGSKVLRRRGDLPTRRR